MKGINFLVVGVGGQGTVLAGDILAEVGMLAGYDAKKSDVLGLAIRGGSVVSHIRWGETVGAPMSMKGTVDYLLASEPLEALRQVEFLHPESTVVYNEYKIPPVSVSSGLAEYPSTEMLRDTLAASARRVFSFDATAKAMEVGSVKSVNVLLLGGLSAFLEVEEGLWESAIEKFVPANLKDVNLKAFSSGRELMGQARKKG
ncbi:MAG: indolepyruvate oxidoreductase subunit beta [Spirochaetales bacterium]|nr:indolepyruvate oxidoreductase subunit beta [Spirochaetales bacterium]